MSSSAPGKQDARTMSVRKRDEYVRVRGQVALLPLLDGETAFLLDIRGEPVKAGRLTAAATAAAATPAFQKATERLVKQRPGFQATDGHYAHAQFSSDPFFESRAYAAAQQDAKQLEQARRLVAPDPEVAREAARRAAVIRTVTNQLRAAFFIIALYGFACY